MICGSFAGNNLWKLGNKLLFWKSSSSISESVSLTQPEINCNGAKNTQRSMVGSRTSHFNKLSKELESKAGILNTSPSHFPRLEKN